jgi:hypothetical protein
MKIYSDYFIELKRQRIEHTHYLVTYEADDVICFAGCYKTSKRARAVCNALYNGYYYSKRSGIFEDYVLKPFAKVPLRGDRYMINGFYGISDGATTVTISKIDIRLIDWPIVLKSCENVRVLFPDMREETDREEDDRFDAFDEKYRLKMDYAN